MSATAGGRSTSIVCNQLPAFSPSAGFLLQEVIAPLHHGRSQMKQKAIDEALVRLDRVRQALASFEDSENTRKEFRTAWWSFLLAANSIYSILQQGSKRHGPSEDWFGTKKHERKKDELLSYLHQARNAVEHTIEGSDAAHGPHVSAGNRWTKVTNDGLDGMGVRATVLSGKPASVHLHAPGIHLLPVRDRGVVFQPPKQHLGKPLPEHSVKGVIIAAEAYLDAMIKEAQALQTHV